MLQAQGEREAGRGSAVKAANQIATTLLPAETLLLWDGREHGMTQCVPSPAAHHSQLVPHVTVRKKGEYPSASGDELQS